jgi:hypothetical protein
MTSLQDRNSLAIEYEGQNSFGNDDTATNIVKCTITKIPLSSSTSTVASFNCQSSLTCSEIIAVGRRVSSDTLAHVWFSKLAGHKTIDIRSTILQPQYALLQNLSMSQDIISLCIHESNWEEFHNKKTIGIR